MKTIFRQTAGLLCVTAALVLSTATTRAETPAKTTHHRRHHTVAPQKSDRTGNGQIPTRDNRESQETPGHALGGANGPEYRVRTGSQIPEHYDRKGHSTDSEDNLFIYDKNDARLRSTNNVGDSLRSVPGVSVSRH